jgi:hypothetical protein
VPAAPSAKGAQKVCCKACRKKRNRELARKRWHAHLQECRQDEVQRKRAQRERERDRRALTKEPESASREAPSQCHALGSSRNQVKELEKFDKIVDEFFELSRATLRQQLRVMLLKTAAQSPMPPARAGP